MLAPMQVWSVGHSTHPLDAFAALLAAHGIETLVDVRTAPKSRRHPQFRAEALAISLPERGVRYERLPRLGGWRRTSPGSPNGAWRNASFRGYADYALTDEFAAGLRALREIAAASRTAMMCSEGLWWRCHRRLIADRLVAGGDAVRHIGPDGRVTAHELPDFAVVGEDGRVRYPAVA
jgi:uncharacterized protein (DUF488 family)